MTDFADFTGRQAQARNVPIRSDVIERAKAEWLQVYARLRKSAWRNEYKYTDWLTPASTAQLLDMSWSNVKRLTGYLKEMGVLDWSPDGKNRRRYFFVELRLELGAKAQICAPGSSGSINPLETERDPLLPEQAQICALHNVIDTDAWAALREAGIGEPARSTLADLPHVTVSYIHAHAAGARRDGVGAGALIFRIQNEWPAPEEWCPECGGLDGEHATGCPILAERRAREAERECRIEAARREPAPAPMSAEMQEAAGWWARALGEMQLQLTGATFDTWLGRTHLVGRDDGRGVIIISVHNHQAKDWLDGCMLNMIQRTLTHVAGREVGVRFVVAGQNMNGENDGSTQG